MDVGRDQFDVRSRELAKISGWHDSAFNQVTGEPTLASDLLTDRAALVRRWPSLSREDRLVLESRGVPPLGGSPGARFIGSETWKAYKTSVGSTGLPTPEYCPPVVVAEGDEVVHLAASTLVNTRTVTDHRAVWPQAAPLSAFTVEPVSTRIVRPWTLDPSEPAAITFADGSAGPELTITVGETDRTLKRATVHVPVRRSVMLDSELAPRLIDRAIMRTWRRVLAKEVWLGGGLIDGVTEIVGVPVVNVGAGTATSAMFGVVEALEGAGYGGEEIVVLLSQVDKRALYEEATFVRDKFERVSFLGFDKLPAGTGFAGAVGSGTLFTSEVSVATSPSHASNLTQALIEVLVEGFVDTSLPDLTSFAKITNL